MYDICKMKTPHYFGAFARYIGELSNQLMKELQSLFRLKPLLPKNRFDYRLEEVSSTESYINNHHILIKTNINLIKTHYI